MNRADLQRISQLRVEEAKVLLDNGYYSGAYYILGYALECALKACITKQINQYDFPDRKLMNDSYTHNLEQLLRLSELRGELYREMEGNPQLELNWGTAKDWSERYRYEVDVPEGTARGFYSAVTDSKNGVLTWLKRYW